MAGSDASACSLDNSVQAGCRERSGAQLFAYSAIVNVRIAVRSIVFPLGIGLGAVCFDVGLFAAVDCRDWKA